MTEIDAFYVRYNVKGFAGPYYSGPYRGAEVHSQAADIRGFEGVYGVDILPVNSVPDEIRKVKEGK